MAIRKPTDPVTDEQLKEEARAPITEERNQLSESTGPTVNTAAGVMQTIAQCKVCGGFKREGLTKTLERFGPYNNVLVCDKCHKALAKNVDLVTE
jgi:hypothetical protein